MAKSSKSLERLRRDIERGDAVAFYRAVARYVKPNRPTEPRIAKALAEAAHEKLRKKREHRTSTDIKRHLRWFTFTWFRRQGCSWEEARNLAAKALGCSEGAIRHAHDEFQKRFKLHGLQPVSGGFENMTPADLLGWPGEGPDEDWKETLRRYIYAEKTLHRLLPRT